MRTLKELTDAERAYIKDESNVPVVAVEAYLDYYGWGCAIEDDPEKDAVSKEFEDLIADLDDRYEGAHQSEEDFAEGLCNECYYEIKNLPDIIRNNINWDDVAYDLFVDDFIFCDGYVFRN